MKGLYKYLDKIGADYEKQFYGGKYFHNVDPVIIPAAQIVFEYGNRADTQNAKKIKAYCRRYNYTIFRTWHNFNGYGLTITTPELYKDFNIYQTYENNSVKEWEQMQHEYLTTGRADEINDKSREIMEKYEKEYLQAIA